MVVVRSGSFTIDQDHNSFLQCHFERRARNLSWKKRTRNRYACRGRTECFESAGHYRVIVEIGVCEEVVSASNLEENTSTGVKALLIVRTAMALLFVAALELIAAILG